MKTSTLFWIYLALGLWISLTWCQANHYLSTGSLWTSQGQGILLSVMYNTNLIAVSYYLVEASLYLIYKWFIYFNNLLDYGTIHKPEPPKE